jgi:glutamate 5-kinase
VTQREHKTALLATARRVVVKVGSNVLAANGGVNAARVRALAREVAAIGVDREVVLVTSGAVAAGQARLGPRRGGIEWRQAAAAVGQPSLMALYERGFASRQRTVAQILVTHADLADRRRHLNARHTILHLLAAGVVPIVNENDTVSVEELKFGDNDDLSAQVATLIDARLLVILSDVAGLHSADPRRDPAATRIAVAEARSEALDAVAGPAQRGVGTGGMHSKLAAARTAAAAGIPTVIADGTRRGVLARVFDEH